MGATKTDVVVPVVRVVPVAIRATGADGTASVFVRDGLSRCWILDA